MCCAPVSLAGTLMLRIRHVKQRDFASRSRFQRDGDRPTRSIILAHTAAAYESRDPIAFRTVSCVVTGDLFLRRGRTSKHILVGSCFFFYYNLQGYPPPVRVYTQKAYCIAVLWLDQIQEQYTLLLFGGTLIYTATSIGTRPKGRTTTTTLNLKSSLPISVTDLVITDQCLRDAIRLLYQTYNGRVSANRACSYENALKILSTALDRS